jgi:hypothetical protein
MTTRRSTLAATAPATRPIEGRWTAWLRRHQDARRARRAVAHALARLQATEPFWNDSLFDRELLARPSARAALAVRDAEALARAWTEQFAYRDPRRRERDVRSLTPLARTFLGWVDEAHDGRLGG